MPCADRVQLGRRATRDETGNKLLSRALDRGRGSPELRLAESRPSQSHGRRARRSCGFGSPDLVLHTCGRRSCWSPILMLVADPGALQELRNRDHCWKSRLGIVTPVPITYKGHLPKSSCRKGYCFWVSEGWNARKRVVKNGLLQRRAVPMARRSTSMWKPKSDHYRGIGAPGSWRTSLGVFFQGSDLSRSHLDVIGRPSDFRITKASHTPPTTHITV